MAKLVHVPKKTILSTPVEGLYMHSMKTPISEDAVQVRDLIGKSEDAVSSVVEDSYLSIGQAAEKLGVSVQTLRNWETEGKLLPDRTAGGVKGEGHRRYSEAAINKLLKKQMAGTEIMLPEVTPGKLRALGEMLLSSFRPDEKLNITLSLGVVDGKVRITVDSEDGLTTVVKTFNIKED